MVGFISPSRVSLTNSTSFSVAIIRRWVLSPIGRSIPSLDLVWTWREDFGHSGYLLTPKRKSSKISILKQQFISMVLWVDLVHLSDPYLVMLMKLQSILPGLQSSEGSAGLDVQGGSLTWLGVDAGCWQEAQLGCDHTLSRWLWLLTKWCVGSKWEVPKSNHSKQPKPRLKRGHATSALLPLYSLDQSSHRAHPDSK